MTGNDMTAAMAQRIFELGRAAIMREEQEARGAAAPAMIQGLREGQAAGDWCNDATDDAATVGDDCVEYDGAAGWSGRGGEHRLDFACFRQRHEATGRIAAHQDNGRRGGGRHAFADAVPASAIRAAGAGAGTAARHGAYGDFRRIGRCHSMAG